MSRKLAVDLQGAGQVLEGQRAVAGEAPVAGQVVVQDRFAGVDSNGPFERFDRLGELAGALVAPAEGEPDVDVVGHQVGAALERQQGLFVAGQVAECFAQQVAGAAVAVDQGAARRCETSSRKDSS